MAKVIITEQYLTDIADAIRSKTGESSATYYPSEMASAILTIGGGQSYEDGDEMEYGSTGALGTWYFNSTIDFMGKMFSGGNGSLIFTSNNTNYSNFSSSQPTVIYDSDWAYFVGWENEAFRTITITGGTYATDSDFIAWLEANAVKQ